MPIPLQHLKAIRTIVSHINCSDGIAAAMIAKDVLPNAEVQFIQYNTKEQLELEAKPGMLFVDFSPPSHRVQEFIDVEAVILDHHSNQKGVVEQFGELGIYSEEPGVSGATLAYSHVWEPLVVADSLKASMLRPTVKGVAELIGIRDTWQTRDLRWELATELHESLMFFPREEWLRYPVFPVNSPETLEWAFRMSLGKYLVKKSRRRDQMIENGALFETIEGVRVAIFQAIGSVCSDAAEKIGDKVDLCMGFTYLVEDMGDLGRIPKLVVSCRSHANFNVGKFVKTLGGGGHERSAAFNLSPVQEGDLNPYTLLTNLLWNYLRST